MGSLRKCLIINFLFLFNINNIFITQTLSDKINIVKSSIRVAAKEPKNGADLIFFGNTVNKDSKIDDATRTSSALAKAMENTKQSSDSDSTSSSNNEEKHSVDAVKPWHLFRTDNDGENADDSKDLIKDNEAKEMRRNLDIDELYDTLKGGDKNNKALKPQDSKNANNKNLPKQEPVSFDKSTIKDAEAQSTDLTTAWLKRHLNNNHWKN